MKRLLPFLTVVVFSSAAYAAETIAYKPVSCIRAGEMAVLQMRVSEKGQLRGYFRRTNTTDWCSVEGVNDGPLSRVTMPKFDRGDEIEYFFVLLDGKRITARSSRIYRSRVDDECTTTWARHTIMIRVSCGPDNQEPLVPASLAAGYQLNGSMITSLPPFASPDKPIVSQSSGKQP